MEKTQFLHTSKPSSLSQEIDLNSMPGSVVVINKQGKMIRSNTSWNEVLLRNHVLSNSISNEDYFEIRRRFNQNDTFEAFQGINRILSGDDAHFSMSFYCNLEMRHFDMKVSSIKLKDGSTGALISHQIKSVQENHHAATEHCNKAIFEAFPDGIVIFDLPNGNIRNANQSFCHFLGYTNEEIKQLNIWDITPEKNIEREKPVLESRLSLYGLTDKQEKVFETRTGESKLTSIRYKAIKENGVITSAWAIIKDLDKSAEEAQKALEAQKQQSLGRMANGMAHELNNILSIILANTEMLDLSASDNDNVHSHAQNIINATHRASRLLKEISQYNKLSDSGFEYMDVFSTVSHALKIVQTALPPNIALTNDLEIRQSNLLGNASQIQQVLLNLAHLITKALDGRVGKMHVDLQRSGGVSGVSAEQFIAIQVGCSTSFINAEDIDNLNAFYLLDKPHKNPILSSLNHVLRNHKGNISAFETRQWHWVRIELPLNPISH